MPSTSSALAVLLAAALIGCGSPSGTPGEDSEPADEVESGTPWPGFVTMTQVLHGTRGGSPVALWREERWTNFRVTSGSADGSSAFLDADWAVTERAREGDEDCYSVRKLDGSDGYPWFYFGVDPFDELSYSLGSGGTADMDTVEGVATSHCASSDPPVYSSPYETLPAWLAPLPFDLPEEVRPQGYEPIDPSLYGPVIAGRIDPSTPDLIQGQWQGQVGDDGPMVTLTWSLSRSADCGDESDARDLLRRESDVVNRNVEDVDFEDEFEGEGRGQSGGMVLAARVMAADAALTYPVVAGVLTGLVGTDQIELLAPHGGSDRSGMQPFVVRMSGDGRVLPSMPSIRRIIDTTCVPDGSFEGAFVLLIGAVQWMGSEFQITMRKVEVQTSFILDAIGERGTGGAEALETALYYFFLSFIGP